MAKEAHEFTVTGHAHGMSKLGLETGCAFSLHSGTQGDKLTVKSITIPRVEALPSYCPWITYCLRVRERRGGNVYDVLHIRTCEARLPVQKKDLIAFLLHLKQTQCEDVEGLRVYGKWLRRTLHELPTTFDELDSVRDAVREDDLLCDRIVTMLEPCMRGPAYMHLLHYFGDAFLAPLSPSQLLGLQVLVQTMPHIFCFWDIAVRMLPDTVHALPLSYAFLCEEHLLAPHHTPTYYRSLYPLWTINRLWEAYEREKIVPVRERAVLEHALRFVLQADKHFYSFGDTSFAYRAFVHAEVLSDDELKHALEFLCGDAPLFVRSRTHATTHADVWVSKVENVLEEIDFVRALRTHVRDVCLIHCTYYHDAFVREFLAWIEQQQLLQHQSRALLLSANACTASYLKEKTGLSVFSMDDAERILEKVKHTMKARGEHIEHIVIDRAHKISISHLLAILRLLEAPGNVNIYLFGDLSEAPVHAHRGGGCLMRDLAQCGYVVTRWTEWNVNDPMMRIYKDLEQRTLARLQVFHFAKRKDLEDKLDALKRQIKRKRKNTKSSPTQEAERKCLFPIFCSTEADREQLLRITFAKQQLLYEKKSFYLGEQVHILERDVIGSLESASYMGMDASGSPCVRVPLHGKEPLDTRKGEYFFTVGGQEYSTQEYTVQHADVMVVSKFCGIPRPHGLFVVGKSTKRNDLLSVVKYCTQSLHIFVLPGVQFQVVDNHADVPRHTGLVSVWRAGISVKEC